MRALTIRPDDADLFSKVATPEQYEFFMSHLSAFKRMWEAEGRIYWLRFLMCLKENVDHSLADRPELNFMYDFLKLDELLSFIYITIHKKYVQSSYSVAKSFMGQAFVLVMNLSSLKEQTRMKNPFYLKDTREAFRELLGKPEVDEDIPFLPVSYLASVYGCFAAAVCTLLKRWLKEPSLCDEAKKKVDYTQFYWKPPSEWSEGKLGDYWPTCFERYLADTYKEDLPKMLLTSNVHNIFLIHDAHEDCICGKGDVNIFDLLGDVEEDDDYDDFETDSDDGEHFLMNQIGYLQPRVQNCAVHSNCYKKVLHDSKCSQPYLCEGSNLCRVTCENSQKNMHTDVQIANFWKKITCETFACKGNSKKRNVSTFAASHNTQIETFFHRNELLDSNEIRKHIQDKIQAEMELDFANNPEFLNSFNQYKQKEIIKNRLRTKFNKKYCSTSDTLNDPDFRKQLFKKARKVWIHHKFREELNLPIFDGKDKLLYVPGSTFSSMKSAETTVAVGTHGILSGRIVTTTLAKACSPTPVLPKIDPAPPIIVSSDSQPKSKKSKKKKKGDSEANKNVPVVSTNKPVEASSATQRNSCPTPDTKEKLFQPSVASETNTKSQKKKKGNPASESKDVPIVGTTKSAAVPSTSAHCSQTTSEKPSSINETTCDKSLESYDKLKEKRPLIVDKSKDSKNALCGKSKSDAKSVAGKNSNNGKAVAGKSESSGKTVAKGSKSSGDAVASESNGALVTNRSKNTQGIEEDNGQLCCFGGCMPTYKSGHMCDRERCSLEACCSGCALFEKDKSSLETPGSAAVITKKPQKKAVSENPIKNALNDHNKLIDSTKDFDLNSNALLAPVAQANLNNCSSAGDAVQQVFTPTETIALGSDISVATAPIPKEDVKRDPFKGSSLCDESNDLNQNIGEKQPSEKNQLSDSVCDLKGKLVKENGVENQAENEVDEISEAVAIEAKTALSKLKFESEEDKPVQEFLTLIGVLKDPSNAAESDVSLAHAKGDSDVKNKKPKLKTCAFCRKEEVTPKTFKRCAKCKAENLAVQRYYCSRECQVGDWQESHRDEHLKNLL